MPVTACADQDPLPFRLTMPAVVVIIVVLSAPAVLAVLGVPAFAVPEVIASACLGAARLLRPGREEH